MSKILVIDDETDLRSSLLKVLKVNGYDTVGAGDGTSGIQLAHEQQPDLIISDIMMPETDGYEVLTAVRKNPRTRTTPFIFVTAKQERKDMRRGMELGADDFLTKPFSTNELLTAVKAQLRKRAAVTEERDTTLNLLRRNIVYALPHELRTPLHIMMGHAQVLKMYAETLSPTELAEIAQSQIDAANRLHRFTENYLVYAQLEVVAADARKREGLRNHIIKDVAEIIEDEARQKAQSYGRQSDLSLELCSLAFRMAEENLRKIVAELVDNAFKFSEPGTAVWIRAVRQDKSLVLQFRDYGCGMTADQAKAIGAYMQFNRAVFEQQGVGLGLVLAKRLVELHSGKLSIKAQSEQGTFISVELPV